jgi:hypothetical protein
MGIKRFDIRDDDHCGYYMRECEDGRVLWYDDHAAAIAEKDAEIARLRRIVEAAREALPMVLLLIKTPLSEIKDLEDALVELDDKSGRTE